MGAGRAIVAAGGGVYAGGACLGPVVYGVSPGPPGLGPGRPKALPPGLVDWAQVGAETASAATIAMPVRRCFMLSILGLLVNQRALIDVVPAGVGREAGRRSFQQIGSEIIV